MSGNVSEWFNGEANEPVGELANEWIVRGELSEWVGGWVGWRVGK